MPLFKGQCPGADNFLVGLGLVKIDAAALKINIYDKSFRFWKFSWKSSSNVRKQFQWLAIKTEVAAVYFLFINFAFMMSYFCDLMGINGTQKFVKTVCFLPKVYCLLKVKEWPKLIYCYKMFVKLYCYVSVLVLGIVIMLLWFSCFPLADMWEIKFVT